MQWEYTSEFSLKSVPHMKSIFFGRILGRATEGRNILNSYPSCYTASLVSPLHSEDCQTDYSLLAPSVQNRFGATGSTHSWFLGVALNLSGAWDSIRKPNEQPSLKPTIASIIRTMLGWKRNNHIFVYMLMKQMHGAAHSHASVQTVHGQEGMRHPAT